MACVSMLLAVHDISQSVNRKFQLSEHQHVQMSGILMYIKTLLSFLLTYVTQFIHSINIITLYSS